MERGAQHEQVEGALEHVGSVRHHQFSFCMTGEMVPPLLQVVKRNGVTVARPRDFVDMLL